MKFFKSLTILTIFVLSQTKGDTLSLVGSLSGNWSVGWWGEAWKNVGWCGDTLKQDAHPDTTVTLDTLHGVTDSISDTVRTTKQSQLVDSVLISTTIIYYRTVKRTSVDSNVFDIIENNKIIIDSQIVIACSNADFFSDTGGPAINTPNFNYYYKVRHWWAQLPFIWNNWQGMDSATAVQYSSILITYKGPLPIHNAMINFIYGTWGANADTMATKQNRGDGVGILPATTEWKTVVIPIPDSVQMPHITGIVFSFVTAPGENGDSTSEVGNFRIAEISLIGVPAATRHSSSPRNTLQDRSHFIPKNAGDMNVSVYSLNGTLLNTKTLSADPSRTYSVRQVAKLEGGINSSQVRIVKIKGAGVDLSEKVW